MRLAQVERVRGGVECVNGERTLGVVLSEVVRKAGVQDMLGGCECWER